MKIVILDGYTLNPGDLDWSALEELGELHVYDRTPADDILMRADEAEILFTNKTRLDKNTLLQLAKLRYIGVLATGYDIVDLQAAGTKNITVTNVPAYGADSVAQMCFAHILQITNNVAGHCQDVRNGGWSNQGDFCYLLSPQIELAGKVMGIIGYGEIGRTTAKLAQAFGMHVVVTTRTPPSTLPDGVAAASLDELLSISDIISLHCPLTEATAGFINEEKLHLMKKEAILVNASRGPLIDEPALALALNNDRIGAACLDVLTKEPPESDNPLLTAKNCYITPHIAWATREARTRLLRVATENLRSYLQGEAQNVISKPS